MDVSRHSRCVITFGPARIVQLIQKKAFVGGARIAPTHVKCTQSVGGAPSLDDILWKKAFFFFSQSQMISANISIPVLVLHCVFAFDLTASIIDN